jgi:hypothetical protein
MGVIEAILAAVGLLTLVVMLRAGAVKADPKPVDDEYMASWREGIRAAVRLQQAARELERQIAAEAAKHAEQKP